MEGFLYVREPESTNPEKLWAELKGFKMYLFESREKSEGYDRCILLLSVGRLDKGTDSSAGFALVLEPEEAGQYVMEADSVREKEQWVSHLESALDVVQQTRDKQRLRALEEERLAKEAAERKRLKEEEKKRKAEERRKRREERARKRQEYEERIHKMAEEELEDLKEKERARMREEATSRAEKAVKDAMRPVPILKFIFHSGPKKPHNRFIALSPNRKNVLWGSNPDKLNRGIAVQDICAVMDGLGTTCLRDNVTDPKLAELCFSIVTHDRTLDAQVEDKKTQATWVLAAEYLKFGLANILKDKKPSVPSLEEVKDRLKDANPPTSSLSDSDSDSDSSSSSSSSSEGKGKKKANKRSSTSSSNGGAASSSSAPPPPPKPEEANGASSSSSNPGSS